MKLEAYDFGLVISLFLFFKHYHIILRNKD